MFMGEFNPENCDLGSFSQTLERDQSIFTARIRKMLKVLFSQVSFYPHLGGVTHLNPITLSLVPYPFQGAGGAPMTGPRSLLRGRGYSSPRWGYPSPRGSTPVPGVPQSQREYPSPRQGVPQSWQRGTQHGVLPSQVRMRMGYPPARTG